MTNLYNTFLLKPSFSNPKKKYISEISFISDFVKFETYFVKFSECLTKYTGFYSDQNNYLKNLYWINRNNRNNRNGVSFVDNKTDFLKMTNNSIEDIAPRTTYYTYIKIINDKQNPQLEDQIMIFKFGSTIANMISEYESGIYKNSFIIDEEYSREYPCFDKCHFSKNEMSFFDKNLDIKSEISFKKFNLIAIERREKLKKISVI